MLTIARRSPVPGAGPKFAPAHEDEAPPSVLGSRAGVRGVLEVDGELVVSGRIIGRIAAMRLVIAKDGYVEGDIVAHDVVIVGRLLGRVFAPTVSIEDGAQVDGRIFHTNVTVARGAHVVGRMPWRPISYFENLTTLPEVRA